MELPDHLTALRNLLPFDFTVKEFQTFVVRAGRKRNVTDVTVGDGPLDGGVEGVEELFDVEDGVRCVQGYAQGITSVDLEQRILSSGRSKFTRWDHRVQQRSHCNVTVGAAVWVS